MRVKSTVVVRMDADLSSQLGTWMQNNGYMPGDEASALKTAVRIAIANNPIVAMKQDTQLKAYRAVQRATYTRCQQFFAELSADIMRSLQEIEIAERAEGTPLP